MERGFSKHNGHLACNTRGAAPALVVEGFLELPTGLGRLGRRLLSLTLLELLQQ
eukprot:SAG22_NODE_16985_length_313_cov_1.205607_1_plen_54_part_00